MKIILSCLEESLINNEKKVFFENKVLGKSILQFTIEKINKNDCEYIFLCEENVDYSNILNILEKNNIQNFTVLEVEQSLKNKQGIADLLDKYISINEKVFYSDGICVAEFDEALVLGNRVNVIEDVAETPQKSTGLYGAATWNIFYSSIREKEFNTILVDESSVYRVQNEEEIIHWDESYLENNNDLIIQLESLRKKMKFEILENLCEDNLDNPYVLTYYLIYLIDTSQLDRFCQIINQNYEKINFATLSKTEADKLNGIANLLYVTTDKRLNGLIFGSKEQQQLYEMAQRDIFEAITYLKKNAGRYFGPNSRVKIAPIVLTYTLNRAIMLNSLDEQFANMILIEVNETNHAAYAPIRKKYIFTQIFEYFKKFDPSFFVFPTKVSYNQVQRMHYLLTNFNMGEYYEGVRYYSHQMHKLHKTKYERINDKVLTNKIPKGKPRVAVCISGVGRFDTEKLLEKHKELIINPLDADVYITTWETRDIYPGLLSQTDDYPWFERYFSEFKKEIPEEINTLGKLKLVLPKTAEKVIQPVKEKNNVELYKKIFPNAIVKILDEKSFEDKYMRPEFIRRNNLNMAKMLYGIRETQALITEEYDYVFRCRPDWTPTKKVTFEQLLKVGPGELATKRHPVVGTLDLMYFATHDTMNKMAEIWDVAVAKDNLSPCYIDGKPVELDIHRMLDLWLIENNIITNNEARPYYTPVFATQLAKLPDVSKELACDLKNLPTEQHERYISLFKKLMKK